MIQYSTQNYFYIFHSNLRQNLESDCDFLHFNACSTLQCVIKIARKGSCMETHPLSIPNPPLSSFQNHLSEETECLQPEVAQKMSEERPTEARQSQKSQWQAVQIDKCSKILYILMLLALAVFISTEVLLDHRINIKKSDKFLNNLDKLKKQGTERSSQVVSDSKISFKKTKGEQRVSDKQMGKQGALSALSKPLQKPQISQQPKNNGPSIITKDISNPILATKSEISQNIRKPQERTKQTTQNPKIQKQNAIAPPSPRKPNQAINTQNPRGRVAPVQRVAGHGVSQALLSKSRIRRSLVALPFNQTNEVSQEEVTYYQQKYHTGNYTELPFCLVIPTYNNVKNDRYLKNIRSVIMQNYTNYHAVIIDDASTDGTGGLILDFLRSQSVLPKERYEIIRNQQQMRAMHNLRFAATNYCKPHEIFMIVDGDDQLLGRQVLKLFNAKFQAENLYFMYTNFLSLSGRVGYSRAFPERIIKENSYRKYPFVTSHLRAFYTQLFLNVRDEDLRDEQGEYLRAANDVAICIPVLEQAHTHVAYVPELTYLYNSNTGLNNHALRLKEQRSNDKKVRTHKKYAEVLDLLGEK